MCVYYVYYTSFAINDPTPSLLPFLRVSKMCDEIKFKLYRRAFCESADGGQIIIKVIEKKRKKFQIFLVIFPII